MGDIIENPAKTIARVRLASSINKHITNCIDKLNETSEYLNDTISVIPNKYISLHVSTTLIGLTSYIDELIRGLLTEIYTCYPEKLGKITIGSKEVLDNFNIFSTLEFMAQKKINELLYKSFREQATELQNELIDGKISEELINCIIEIKATRDLIAHGEKEYNDTYLRKVNNSIKKSGDKVNINLEYIENALNSLLSFVECIKIQIKQSYMDTGKKEAVKILWENSVMNKLLDFNEAWLPYGDDMIRPSDKMRGRYYSTSEEQIQKFF